MLGPLFAETHENIEQHLGAKVEAAKKDAHNTRMELEQLAAVLESEKSHRAKQDALLAAAQQEAKQLEVSLMQEAERHKLDGVRQSAGLARAPSREDTT